MNKRGKGEEILQHIVNGIHSGEYLPGERMPSGLELAARYGVAHLTIRRVLEQLKLDGHITMRPRQGIYVRELPQRKHVVVVIEYSDDAHALFPRALQVALADMGCIINVFDLRVLVNQPEVFFSAFGIHQDYLVMRDASLLPDQLFERIPAEVSKIFYHCFERERPRKASLVLSDSADAGYKGIQALAKFGCRRTMLIANETIYQEHSASEAFLDGVNRAAADYGIAKAKVFMMNDIGEKKLKALLESGRYDGVAAGQDSYLVPVVQAAGKLGISIPGDLALVGHNNTPWARQYNLTSTDIQVEETVRRITDIIRNDQTPAVHMTPALTVYRKSCPQK